MSQKSRRWVAAMVGLAAVGFAVLLILRLLAADWVGAAGDALGLLLGAAGAWLILRGAAQNGEDRSTSADQTDG
jgi:hypothetical protein